MKNLANIITLSRICFVFVVIGLLYCTECPTSYYAALFLTAILMWFDGLDGFVARKFNISSRFGALLDIMGDRIVENAFWISFCALGWINVIIPLIPLLAVQTITGCLCSMFRLPYGFILSILFMLVTGSLAIWFFTLNDNERSYAKSLINSKRRIPC